MSEIFARRKTWLLVAGAIVIVLLVSAPLLRRDNHVRYLASKVEQGEIKDVVESTGVVNAVVNVQVGSQVSGTISKLNADFNSRVHKGEIIAEIDPRLFQGALLQAEQKNVGTQQALDQAKANYDSAKASVEAAVASVEQANAQVSQKEAAVSVARTNLNYTIIRSPIDGTVVARNVDVGQTVAASLQAPTIFTIAQDLVKMLVYAKVDESDVGRIRAGEAVTFKVDAFPKELIRGVVTQIRMNPTTVQNVVTYDAVIEFQNRDLKLFPGMTAYVTIPVATAENVVKLPNAAIRFKPPLPPETLRSLYAKYGISTVDTERAVVWKLHGDETVEPVEVALGITDHTYTEVAKVVTGRLKPGDDVVTSSVTSNSVPPGAQGIRR